MEGISRTDNIGKDSEISAILGKLAEYSSRLEVTDNDDYRKVLQNTRELGMMMDQLNTLLKFTGGRLSKAQEVLNRIRKELDEACGVKEPEKKEATKETTGNAVSGKEAATPGSGKEGASTASGKDTKKDTWLTKVGGRTVISSNRPATESIVVAPGIKRIFISINRIEDCLKYHGRSCVVATTGYMVMAVDDHIVPLWIARRFTERVHQPHKVMAHHSPDTVLNPAKSSWYVSPTHNPNSTDTRNFMRDTQIRPASLAEPSTQYAVRVGGYETIADDLDTCAIDQLEYAQDFYASGILPALVIMDSIKEKSRKE